MSAATLAAFTAEPVVVDRKRCYNCGSVRFHEEIIWGTVSDLERVCSLCGANGWARPCVSCGGPVEDFAWVPPAAPCADYCADCHLAGAVAR